MKTGRFIPNIIALVAGIAIMAIAILVKHEPEPPAGEYHYSTLLRNGFGWLAIVLMVLTGLAIGYRFRANPFLIGICLIAAFPITAIVEATVFKGSHNMIPVELGVYLLYAVPGMAGSYIGKLMSGRARQNDQPK